MMIKRGGRRRMKWLQEDKKGRKGSRNMMLGVRRKKRGAGGG